MYQVSYHLRLVDLKGIEFPLNHHLPRTTPPTKENIISILENKKGLNLNDYKSINIYFCTTTKYKIFYEYVKNIKL